MNTREYSLDQLEITITELKDWLEQKKAFTMLDVREPWELEKVAFDQYQHIRLGELQDRWDEIDQTHPIVVICHHGKRSLMACCYLRERGIERVLTLKGGIHAWAQKMDTSMATY